MKTDSPVCPDCLTAVPRFPDPERIHSYSTLKVQNLSCLGPYDGALRTLLHAWKFSERSDLEFVLADLAMEVVPEFVDSQSPESPPVLIPVPSTLRAGRDAVSSLATVLARRLGVELLPVVERSMDAVTQLGATRPGRFQQAEEKFAFRSGLARGRRILLFDDIITSGATLTAVSRRLFEDGAESISAWTVAARLSDREDYELA